MPYLLVLKKQQNLKLLSAANCRPALYGLTLLNKTVSYHIFEPQNICGSTNSEGPDQTAPSRAVWSGPSLFLHIF